MRKSIDTWHVQLRSRMHQPVVALPSDAGDSMEDLTRNKDDDSFLSAQQSNKSSGYKHLHSNTPQNDPRLLFHSPQKVMHLDGDDESMVTAISLNEHNYSISDDSLISFESAIQTKTPYKRLKEICMIETLPSLPFFIVPSTNSLYSSGSENSEKMILSDAESLSRPGTPKSVYSQSLFHDPGNDCSTIDSLADILDHDCIDSLGDDLSKQEMVKYDSLVQILDSDSIRPSMQSNDSKKDILGDTRVNRNYLFCTSSFSSSVSEDSFSSFGWYAPEYSEADVKDASRPCTATTMNSTIPFSECSLTSSESYALNAKRRSVKRRIEHQASLKRFTSSSSNTSTFNGKKSCHAADLVLSQKLTSVVPSSIVSHKPVPLSFESVDKPVEKLSSTAQVAEKLLEEVSQSPHDLRVQKLKKKLRLIEIEYFREKCLRRLKKCMAHFMKLERNSYSSFLSDDSSVCSELSMHDHDGSVPMIPQGVFHMGKEMLCFNLVISAISMFYVFYGEQLMNPPEDISIKRLTIESEV